YEATCFVVSEVTRTDPIVITPGQLPNLAVPEINVCSSDGRSCGIFPRVNEPFKLMWVIFNNGNAPAAKSTTRVIPDPESHTCPLGSCDLNTDKLCGGSNPFSG